MLEIFDKFRDKTAVIKGDKTYTYSDIKGIIGTRSESLKSKKDNIVLFGDDSFSFIINFFASLVCEKNIYLITDKTKINTLDFEYDIPNNDISETQTDISKEIDINKPLINFYTSGSTSKPKIITKSLYNLIKEAEDIGKVFNFKNLTVVSTTTMAHQFGITFHLMSALCNGLTIDTTPVSYPENVDKENTILVSTPTFLSTVPKFNLPFTVSPKYIITAGSKLDENVFKILEEKSNIIEIYGSTETGVMAHKEHTCDDFRIFDTVKLDVKEDCVDIYSEYFYEDKTTVNDKIEVQNGLLKIKKRTDRMFKINEKRVSADELETELKKHDFVKNCYITKSEDKLVCLCALSKDGQKDLLENNISHLTKILKQHLLKVSEIVPQKWKYIDEIPMTQTGKINKPLIEHIFNLNLSLPVILDRTLEENSITYKIFFYKQCNFFNGHFPKYPIVPGVVQLFLTKELANAHFGLNLGQGQWKRIKFSNIIKTDSIVYIKLDKTEKNVNYEIYSDTKKYASGVFLCENIFEGM